MRAAAIITIAIFAGCRTLQPTEINIAITDAIENNKKTVGEIRQSDDIKQVKQISIEAIERNNDTLKAVQTDYNDCLVLHDKCQNRLRRWKMAAFMGWVLVAIEMLLIALIFRRNNGT